MKVILAIDGGGSRTRCLAIDQQGRVVGKALAGPSNHLLIDAAIVSRSLTEVIDATLADGQLDRSDVACVSAGLAGVDFDGAGAPEMEALLRDLGFERVVINGDMVIAHAGALGSLFGVVTLSGTGSVTLGIDRAGRRVKVGGWGPIYGDEGSAYRIGEMALRASARAYDGRGPATVLTSEILTALNLKEFRETIQRVYVEEMEPREIAALSRIAYKAAEAGDEIARKIFIQAGEELAESVNAAINQLEWEDAEVLVSYQGAVLESCPLLFERFVETLKTKAPKNSVVAPRFEPVIGAYLLGCKELDWQLDPVRYALACR
ncbi:MAG TPA: BadF/BadG/BcrA/BcrD ATPase family protein [Pyrinomonadaceae bacterium]